MRDERAYHKGWQSERPLTETSRKVKFYLGKTSVRLLFQDEHRRASFITTDFDLAEKLYEDFIAGRIDTADVMDMKERV
jgi:hypothetical protein